MKIQKWDEINGTGSSEERMEAFLTSETDTYAILQLSYEAAVKSAWKHFSPVKMIPMQSCS